MRTSWSIILLAAVCGSALAQDAAPPEVAYPAGYRDWRHVSSMVINPGHPLFDSFGGVHHLYANAPALAGYAAGKFPDGAVIVFDLLEAKVAENAVTEGPRKLIGVMHKNSKAYAATGGWGFEGFKGDSKSERLVTQANAAGACFGCHAGQDKTDFVFSKARR
ncbi:MAG: cytochrome P460 family protein [Rhodospirillaceae bacterium]|nr:cytochrome P460 family protein [Rhodospirillaceae bacterium]